MRVEGPGARDALAGLLAPLGGAARTPKTASASKRFAKAAGFGTAGALVICCVLPIGAVALLGVVAAPLAGLDNPLVIGATAVLFGGVAWFFAKRREQAACADC